MTYGPFTASGLGGRLGESSGATSYHLRQLEKHSFVRKLVGRGTGRERWWERMPDGITIDVPGDDASESARAASRLVLREWMTNRTITLKDFLDRGDEVLPMSWREASMINLSNLMLTREQTRDLSGRLMTVMDEFVTTYRDQSVPGARPVQAHINVFPVLDTDQIPDDRPNEDDR